MRALVTGGAGFVGSNLVRALLERGYDVVVLDSFATGRRENLEEVLADIDLHEGDLRSAEAVHAATAGAEVVFHQGALPSVPRSIEDPVTTNAVNVDGTMNVLLAARDVGVRRVVFASSSSIYGDAPGLPRHEEQRVSPIAPYGVAKLAAESYCRSFSLVYGLETVALRYFNVFGPRQDPASQYAAAVPRFITRLLRGEPPIIEGDGEQSRDFTFVADVVRANLLAALVDGGAGETFNVAGGRPRTINELAGTLARIIGADVEPVHVEARKGDIRESAADIGKAREILGFEPKDSFESGLEATVAFFRSAS